MARLATRFPKMKTENILIIIIIVLIVLIVLYWLFRSMRRRNIHEGLFAENDGSNYAKSSSKERPGYKPEQDYHQIFNATSEQQPYSTLTDKDYWNDCANNCAKENDKCLWFSATKNASNKISCNFYKDIDYSKVKFATQGLSGNNHIWIKAGNDTKFETNKGIKDRIWKDLKPKLASCSIRNDDYNITMNNKCYKSYSPSCNSPSTLDDKGNCITSSDPICPDGYKVSQADKLKCIPNDDLKAIDNTKLFCRGGDARINKDNKLECTNNGKLQCDDGYLLGVDNKCRPFLPKKCSSGSLNGEKCTNSVYACGDKNKSTYDNGNKMCNSNDNDSAPMCPKGYKYYSANNNYCEKM